MAQGKSERRIVVAALLLIVVLLGAWKLFSQSNAEDVAFDHAGVTHEEPLRSELVGETDPQPISTERETAAPTAPVAFTPIASGFEVLVIDGAERPLAGVLVWVWNPGNWGMRDNFVSETTGLDGFVKVEGLEAREVYVEIRADSLPPLLCAPAELHTDLPADGGRRVKIICPGSASIYGRVTDAAGKPIPRAWIRVESRTNDSGDVKTFSDIDGHYEVRGVYPGKYDLDVFVPIRERALWSGRTLPRAKRLTLEPGERKLANLACTSDGRSLRGRIFDTQGTPVAGVVVRASLTRTFNSRMISGKDIAFDRSDEDGAWSLTGLPSDQLQLTIGDRAMTSLRRDHVLLDDSHNELLKARGQTLEHTVIVREGSVRYRLTLVPTAEAVAQGIRAGDLHVKIGNGFTAAADEDGLVTFSGPALVKPWKCTVGDWQERLLRFELPATAGALVEREIRWGPVSVPK
jgi:protocatechuate 3,4-dioxygenase beta subunit